MKRREKLSLVFMFLVAVFFILIPILEQLLCSDPQPDITRWFLIEIGAVKSKTVCPTLIGAIISMLRNAVLIVSGSLIGYVGSMIRKKTRTSQPGATAQYYANGRRLMPGTRRSTNIFI